jgi:hypothetical protein
MGKHAWIWASLALVAAGCHKGTDSGQAEEEVSADQEEGAQAAPEQEEPFVVTPEKLDKYIAYQDTTGRIYQESIARIQKMVAKADAGAYEGTLGAFAGAREGMKLVEAQEEAREKARKETGLSQRDIDKLQDLVSDVMGNRKMAAMVNYDAQIKQFEAMREKVPADQRASLDETIKSLKAQQEQATKLDDERKRFGDANVDAVLAREKDLTAAYDRWVKAVLGAGKAKK